MRFITSTLVAALLGVQLVQPGLPQATANGQIPIGASTGTYAAATITAGSGVTVTNAANSITIAAPTFTLIKASSGTDTSAAATNLDTCSISGLTAKDALYVEYELESATQLTAVPLLYNSTDAVNMVSLDGTQNIAANARAAGSAYAIQRVAGVTSVNSWSVDARSGATAPASDNVNSAFTTNWTGSWTLALRHGGVVAGGTLSWKWAVYKKAGQ